MQGILLYLTDVLLNNSVSGLATEVLTFTLVLLIHYVKQELEHSFNQPSAFTDNFYSELLYR